MKNHLATERITWEDTDRIDAILQGILACAREEMSRCLGDDGEATDYEELTPLVTAAAATYTLAADVESSADYSGKNASAVTYHTAQIKGVAMAVGDVTAPLPLLQRCALLAVALDSHGNVLLTTLYQMKQSVTPYATFERGDSRD